MDIKEVKEKIMERGYWEIEFQPAEYDEKKFDFKRLNELLEKYQVRYRGWYYPHFSNTTKYGDCYNKENYVESFVHWAAYLEIFRFYRSGQFIHYMGMTEDRLEDHSPMFVEWTPEMQKKPPTQTFLEPTMALHILTEILIFVSKLTSENIFGDEVTISIKLHNMNHRILKTLDFRRAPFHTRECHSETIELGPVTYSRESLNAEHDKLAVDWTIEILSQFSFSSEHIRKVLENDQKNFYNKKFTF